MTEVSDPSILQFVEPLESNWQCVETLVDSGAARSVCPVSLCRENGIIPAPDAPAFFRTASGERVANHGQRKIKGFSEDGAELSMLYNVADVSTPLDAVSALCDKGNVVIFTSDGGWICGKRGRMAFIRKMTPTFGERGSRGLVCVLELGMLLWMWIFYGRRSIRKTHGICPWAIA